MTNIAGLDSEQIEHYREHGFIAPIDVMSEDEAAGVLAELETAERAAPDQLNPHRRNNPHLAFPFLADVCCDQRIVDRVVPLVGDDLVLWSTVLFIKEPDSSAFVSWHQDGFYMALEPDDFVTAWLALTPSTIDSGCVSVIPGTHQQRSAHRDTFGADNILTRGQEVPGVDATQAVHLELRPGQMSLHHPWLVHGSQPNRSDGRRVGLAMQSYLGSDVRPLRGDHHVMWIRGRPVDDAFTEAPRPAANSPAARAAREAANQAFADVLYEGAERRRSL